MTYRNERDSRGPQEPPLPKPYEFVPLSEAIPRGEPLGHQRYRPGTLSGTLSGTLVARSPVHVASGLLHQQPRARDYPLIKEHFRTRDELAIPGTSLKGCIRSIVEAISRSSVQVTRARELSRRYQPSFSPRELDVAQRIFGTLGYQGMLRFGDAVRLSGGVVTVPTPQLFRPRPESSDTYFDGSRPRGRKFYMHGQLARGNLPLEACAEGSTFNLRMDFEGLTPGELGLVLTALGLGHPQLWPKLGGGKPACLGTIETTGVQIVAFDGVAAYADFDAAPQPIDVAALRDAARSEGLVLEPQLERLAEVLRWPRTDRNCPDRSY